MKKKYEKPEVDILTFTVKENIMDLSVDGPSGEWDVEEDW